MLQICTSTFVQPIWLKGYFDMKFENPYDVRNLWQYDFRNIGWYYFYNIASFCIVAKETVAVAESLFLTNKLISAQILNSNKYEI